MLQSFYEFHRHTKIFQGMGPSGLNIAVSGLLIIREVVICLAGGKFRCNSRGCLRFLVVYWKVRSDL